MPQPDKNISIGDLIPKLASAAQECVDRSYTINIAGQSAVGKSTISSLISSVIEGCIIVNMDDYLRGWGIGQLNHDSDDPDRPFFAGLNPQVYDLDRLYLDVIRIKSGEIIEKPVFDPVEKEPVGSQLLVPGRALIIDGIYALEERFGRLADSRLLIEAPLHDRLMRKIIRNNLIYREPVDQIVATYLSRDEPAYFFYQEELRAAADFIVDNPADPLIDYRPLLPNSPLDVLEGTRFEVLPRWAQGSLHSCERLQIARVKDGLHELQYVVANHLLVSGQISDRTLGLVEKFYELKAI